MKEKIKVVVTGALGHIGSRLIRELSSPLVERVTMVDNMEAQRYCSLFDLPDKFEYKFFEQDVRTADLDKIFEGADAVVHLAALTNAEASHGREKETESVNLEGLKRAADACSRVGARLLFPSTTSVYGSQESLVDETCAELKPQSPYADSKLAAEDYLRGLKDKGLKFTVCRFGTIFGYSIGMRYHTAVNKFTWQAVNGMPLTVWKTAWEQKRPYLYLGDCVAAINFILERDLFDGEVYNVLTKNFTVKDIVEAIGKFISDPKVNYVDSPIMNQLSYEVDDGKIKKLGFAPSGDLENGLAETFAKLNKIKI